MCVNKKNVLGFKMLFGKDFYQVAKSKREWLIGSNASLFMARKVAVLGMVEERPNELYRQMIHNNKLTVTEFDEESGVATLTFKIPVPVDIFRELYPDDEIITD